MSFIQITPRRLMFQGVFLSNLYSYDGDLDENNNYSTYSFIDVDSVPSIIKMLTGKDVRAVVKDYKRSFKFNDNYVSIYDLRSFLTNNYGKIVSLLNRQKYSLFMDLLDQTSRINNLDFRLISLVILTVLLAPVWGCL